MHTKLSILAALLFFSACTPQATEDPAADIRAQLTSPECVENMPDEVLEQFYQHATNHETMQTQPKSGDTVASLSTTLGDISILLYTEKAPLTATNFKELAEQDKYNETLFHRVIDCFMVQTGDFENGNGTGGHSAKGPGTAIQDEFGEGLKHIRGAVSMANSAPHTGGSQFFIVQNELGTPWLDGKHAIFGFVFEGMDIVDKMTATPTDGGDRPLEEIRITGVTIESYK